MNKLEELSRLKREIALGGGQKGSTRSMRAES